MIELVLEPLREEQYYEVHLDLLFPISSSYFVSLELLSVICLILFSAFTDKGTLLRYVSCEKPNGSDDGIYAGCCVSNAQTNGEHG